MNRFTNRWILITGGTSGIGLATAQRLIGEGARVIVTGSRQASLDKARGVLGENVVYLQNDAGDATSSAALVAAVRTHTEKLDGIYFNAGFGRFAPFDAAEAADFDEHFAVNVRGPLLQARALSPLLGAGSNLLFTTSIVDDMGMPGSAIYAATKGALRTLTKVLAAELAPRQIRVNAVSPGPIETAFFERNGMAPEAISEFGSQVVAQVPLGRFGKASEVAAVAAFLLSDDASFITGAEYAVDGGMGQV
ncbi:MAG: SDR family oxidoreductase [Lysobacterales bacterium]